MKRLVLFISLIISHYTVFGQTEKDSFLLGGLARVDLTNEPYAFFSPQLGMFMAKNFALGATVPISFSSTENSNSFYYGFGPFFRGYFGSSKFKPFLEGGIYFATEHTKFVNNNREFKSRRTDNKAHLATGITYFLSPNIGLEGVLKYQVDREYEFTGANLIFNLGLQIYIPKKKNEN
ncbi:hypothetical protein BH23BAC1_BH23BAC1_28230 [soil metagenome]